MECQGSIVGVQQRRLQRATHRRLEVSTHSARLEHSRLTTESERRGATDSMLINAAFASRAAACSMCRNAEWMMCVIQGKACRGGGGDGQIVFSLAPATLDMEDFDSRPGWYTENDIYYLEVCTLNEMCSNRDELFTAEVGDSFFCKLDRQQWQQAKRDMMALG